MNLGGLLLILALADPQGHALDAGDLPTCPNGVINEVVRRAGCTHGDARCWLAGGGFCDDYVELRVTQDRPMASVSLVPVEAGEVRRGDVAVFLSRAHYAFVERVIVDRAGRPVSVVLSEYNYGTCWVDEALLVTDKYGRLTRRSNVRVAAVDGGFLRAVPARGPGEHD